MSCPHYTHVTYPTAWCLVRDEKTGQPREATTEELKAFADRYAEAMAEAFVCTKCKP